MKKVILLNGPPSSGKDLGASIIGAYLHNRGISRRAMKFADPLKIAAHTLFGVPFSCEHYESEYGNVWKDTPSPLFGGSKPRDVYIDVSENVAKKHGGPEHFGLVAARIVDRGTEDVFVFSDSGFFDELLPLVRLVGGKSVLVIELHRPEHNFDGDSRGYLSEKISLDGRTQNVVVKKLYNNEDKQHFAFLIKGAVKGFLGLED